MLAVTISGLSTIAININTHMENTAKNFALQLGSLISLYVSIGAIISMLFGVIMVQYPDAAQGYWEVESAGSMIRFSIALAVVFFPTYIILTRIVNNIRRNEHGVYLALTKWLIYLSLLVGGISILVDFVILLNGFLSGELTIRFALKSIAFFIVVGTALVYYVYDARGYWNDHEKQSLRYGSIVSIATLLIVTAGFMNTATPKEVREMNIDENQINDLGIIQSNIESYYTEHTALPQTLDMIYSNGVTPIQAPEERSPYTYRMIDINTFELCADFAHESNKTEKVQYSNQGNSQYILNAYDWTHSKGHWCFTRKLYKTSPPVLSA